MYLYIISDIILYGNSHRGDCHSKRASTYSCPNMPPLDTSFYIFLHQVLFHYFPISQVFALFSHVWWSSCHINPFDHTIVYSPCELLVLPFLHMPNPPQSITFHPLCHSTIHFLFIPHHTESLLHPLISFFILSHHTMHAFPL